VIVTLLLSLTSFSFGQDPATNWLKMKPATSPSGRGAMAMVYDGVSRKIILFGGYDSSSYLNDTWTWNGATWTKIATNNAPSPRAASGIGFDRVTGKVVLFGGFDGSNYLGDTWLWDGATSTWTQANPATVPTAVTLPMLFNDPLNGHVDQFGGFDGFLFQGITWRWSGSDWIQVPCTTNPYARGAGTAVYDPVHKNVVLWGGLGDLNPLNTWTFDGTNNHLVVLREEHEDSSRYARLGLVDGRCGATFHASCTNNRKPREQRPDLGSRGRARFHSTIEIRLTGCWWPRLNL
jgi:hypothetical protein